MKQIKKELVNATKQILSLGLNIGSEGNISCRCKDKIFITPSGIESSQLDESLISEVDINGYVKNSQKPSSEIFMHL